MGLGLACLLAAEDRDLALGPRPPRVAHAVACRAVERHRARRRLGGGEAAAMPGAAAVAQAAMLDVAGGAAEALVAAARSGHARAVPAANLAHRAPAQGGVAQSAPLQPPSHAQPLSVHAPWPEQLALHESSAHPAWRRVKVRGRGRGESEGGGRR